MQKYPRITGVTGWAIPEKWFEEILRDSFPDFQIQIINPLSPKDPELAGKKLNDSPADIYIGYSLGSLWLNLYKEHLPRESKLILVAPILNITTEGNMGGKFPMRKLRLLIKQVEFKSDYLRYVLEFFDFCGINISDKYISEIPSRTDLLEGLIFLNDTSIPEEWPNDDLGAVGDEDPLLDATALKQYMPNLIIVKGASHDPEKLLTAIARNPISLK